MSGPAAERLKDKYQSKLSQAENEAKHLKDKQKEIKDTHTTGLSQIEMMSDLVRLLQLKVCVVLGEESGSDLSDGREL